MSAWQPAPPVERAAADGYLQIANATRGTVLADRAVPAHSFFARTRGLMGARPLPEGGGLLLVGDSSIHTCFMRFPIDAAFLDRNGVVLHLVHGMVPWRISRIVWRARSVLELPAGILAQSGTQVGDQLTFSE